MTFLKVFWLSKDESTWHCEKENKKKETEEEVVGRQY